MARPSPYPPELRERAVRMVAEIRPNDSTEWAAMKAVAAKLGIGAAETVRTWSAMPKSTVASGLASRPRKPRRSSGWRPRTPSCAEPTKS
jgi:transposase-like protein